MTLLFMIARLGAAALLFRSGDRLNVMIAGIIVGIELSVWRMALYQAGVWQ